MEDPAWETSKENVLPIKSGRSTKKLTKTFLAQSEGFSIENGAVANFENELISAKSAGADLLDVWVRYFKWTRDQYPSDSTKAMQILERCTAQLVTISKYKNDNRFIQLWVEYVSVPCLWLFYCLCFLCSVVVNFYHLFVWYVGGHGKNSWRDIHIHVIKQNW